MDELQQTYFRMLKAKKQQRLARAVTSGEHDAKGKERRDVTGRPGTEAVAAEYKNDAATTTPTTGGGGAVVDLDTFGKQLQKLVRFNGYEIIAAIQDPSRGSAREGSGRGQGRAHASLVTSIEFDKEVSSPLTTTQRRDTTNHRPLLDAVCGRRGNILRWRATTSESGCSTIARLLRAPAQLIFLFTS